ncbi:hypothetical protein BCR36DRAFT_164976 [Piromyces finnis]|uniref:Uncharacterized protein n=1 Tax=Piromyces finnis TaxID=1754191 RepID=A0A1Y1VHX5_9FUNG|nr:hypothetical protein BCR36DRAFT_164976 [Piromyces finnis]|eukprot:ORX56639.1 hypothetical protein BCR36DRAFT_164976 [Piromyces finnis]
MIYIGIGVNYIKPACKIGHGEITKSSVQFIHGDSFNKKICIKPNSVIQYAQLDIPNNKYCFINLEVVDCERILAKADRFYDCYLRTYRTPNYKIVNTCASCNKYGYLTRYGWVESKNLC